MAATIPEDSADEWTSVSERFVAIRRNRDAWATIRGFVYQVDVTISRWISLGPDDLLELERAEDIDAVVGALVGDQTSKVRLIEQVKHRRETVTLRNVTARVAIANFFDHRRANPQWRLRFRFTTTATVGRERLSPMPGKMPGIAGWQAIQDGRLPPNEQQSVLGGLRKLLEANAGPSEVSRESWIQFQVWIHEAPDVELEKFINDFEWAVASPDQPSLRAQVIVSLVDEGHATSGLEARRLYERLFVHVFSLLSTPGVKRLSASDLRGGVKDLDSENELYQQLHGLHVALEARVEALEDRVSRLSTDVEAGTVTLAAISERLIDSGIQNEFGAGGTVVDPVFMALPPLVEPPVAPYASRREGTVAQLTAGKSRKARGPRVISLFGAQASGKSQLALQIGRHLAERRLWISFLGLDSRAGGQRLAIAIARSSNIASTDWARHTAAFWDHNDVLVLDDVPPFLRGDEFGVRLAVLIAAGKGASTIVITSLHRLASLDALTGIARISNSVVPLLSTDEVHDVLAARGMIPDQNASSISRLVHGVTMGHPVLVQAVSEYVARHKWRVDGSVLMALFGKSYAHSVNNETIRVLLESVSDEETRSLVYRLAIADLEFEEGVVTTLSEAPPPISRPIERFSSLVGPWIEAVGDGRYRLSQLVRSIGPLDVGESTQQECHRRLGERIVHRKRLSESEALQAFSHFTAGKDDEAAAGIMFRALHALTRTKDLPSYVGRIWTSLLVPTRASSPVRLQLYAFQIVLAFQINESPRDALSRIHTLMEEANLPAWAVFTSSLTIVVGVGLKDASIAAGFMSRALMAWPQLPEEMRLALDGRVAPRGIGIESLPWLVAGGVHDEEDLFAWLDALDTLPTILKPEVFDAPLGREVSSAVFNRLLVRRWDLPEAERNWAATAQVFHVASERVKSTGSTILEAAAIGAELTCLFEAGGEMASIHKTAALEIERLAKDPDAAFLVTKQVAFETLDRGDNAAAVAWLRKAAAITGTLNGFDRAHIEVRLSQLLIQTQPEIATLHAARAVELARSHPPGIGATLLPDQGTRPASGNMRLVVQTLGELAITQWQTGDRIAASLTIIEALDVLLSSWADDVDWRNAIVRLGHICGYFVSVLKFGQPPASVVDGSPYVAPFIGMMIRSSDADTAALYDKTRFQIVGVHAMMLAEFAGENDLAVRWAVRSVTTLKDHGLWAAATIPLQLLVRDALMRSEFAQAFEYGTDMVTAFWANLNKAKEAILVTSPMPKPVPKSELTSDGEQDQFNSLLLDQVVIPAVFKVASTWMNDRALGIVEAESLCDACMGLSAEYDSQGRWQSAAEIVEKAFIARTGAATLIEIGNALNDDSVRTLRALAYFLASFDEHTTPQYALYTQLTVVEFLIRKLELGSETLERIAIPVLERYWRDRFERARFLFQFPRIVSTALNELPELPLARLKKLLSLMASSLSVQIPTGSRAWIEGNESV